jgi:glycine dehydrogenase subunit 2
LDHFIDIMIKVLAEAKKDPAFVQGAPYSTPVTRLDEVFAAKQLILRWKPEAAPAN